MRLRDTENNEHNSAPKLALFSSFANRVKLQSPIGMSTPPIHRTVAIPFRWEEAPGKPRPYATESKPNNSASPATTTTNNNNTTTVRRCLELPPRLLLPEANVTNMPSPTAVLDGPYVGCRSLTSSLSFRSSGGGCTDLQSRSKKLNRKERLSLSRSTRWGSFKKIREVVKGSFDLSSSSTKTISNREGGSSGVDGDDGDGDAHCTKKKIAKARRKDSFLNLTFARSHLFTSVYESVKQAVPWRRREEKVRKMASSSTSIV